MAKLLLHDRQVMRPAFCGFRIDINRRAASDRINHIKLHSTNGQSFANECRLLKRGGGFKDDVQAESPRVGFGPGEITKAGKRGRSSQRNQGACVSVKAPSSRQTILAGPRNLLSKGNKKRGNSPASRITLHVGAQKLLVIAAEDDHLPVRSMSKSQSMPASAS